MASLCFIFQAFLSCIFLHSVVSGDSLTIAQEATALESPLTPTGLERVQGDVFGTARGVRSSDVVIFNKSGRDFSLFNINCGRGGWSLGLSPENSLPARSTTVFGAESNGFLGSVTCTAAYRTKVGSLFEIETDNPFLGHNGIEQWVSSELKISAMVGSGNSNIVRFLIEDKPKENDNE